MSDNFGDFIKEKRARCNYSLKYVAEIIGISNVYQSSIEAGKRPAPSYDVLMKLRDALKLNDDESIGSVYVDAQKITYDIVNNYLEKGKNDIIFVSPQQNLIRTVDLIEGMKKAYQDHQLPFDESTQVINTSTHYEESYTQFVEHFRNHKHDLVFASYDKEGVAVVNAAIDNNINIPDDMEVMAMMDTSYSLICRPSLSTIHLPIYDMGALAVRLLTKILNQEELETKEVCVGYTNIYRKSTIQ